jgi:hypothetical protein
MPTKAMFAASRKQIALAQSVREQQSAKKTGVQQMWQNVNRSIAAKMISDLARILAARLAN